MAEDQSSFLRRTTRRALAASGITAAILYGWWQAVEGARTPPSLPEIKTGSSLAMGRVVLPPLSIELRQAASSSEGAQPLLLLSASVDTLHGETQTTAHRDPHRLVPIEEAEIVFDYPEVRLVSNHKNQRQHQ